MPPLKENSCPGLSAVLGGERQRSSVISSAGYSESPLHWKPSYLEPISQSMQKKVEGVYRIGVFSGQWHIEKAVRVYLERISGSMQKPIEGLSAWRFAAINKGAIDKHEH
jgi:hypothetical protein